MFTFSEMLALVESESSFGAYVCHRRPGGCLATSDLVAARTYRWCCRKLEVRRRRPFVVTVARRLTIDESCLSILPSCKWVFCDVGFFSNNVLRSGLSSEVLSVTHK